MVRFGRTFWVGTPIVLRAALIVECLYTLLELLWDGISDVAMCAEICADKQMTIWDIVHDNAGGPVLGAGLALLTISAFLLVRHRPALSLVPAAIPIVGFAAMLGLFAAYIPTAGFPLTFSDITDDVIAISTIFFIPAAACTIVIVHGVRSRGFRRRGGIAKRSSA